MDTRVFCVYNLARGVFLSSKVTTADGVNEPLKILKVLVSGLGLDAVSGLWICPLSAIPAVPRLFPFDFIYLDRDQRVIEAAEIVPGADFPPYRSEVASALVLARRTVSSTQTVRGDRLIICVDSEVDREIAAAGASDPELIGAHAQSPAKPKGLFKKNGKEKGTATSVGSMEPFSSVGVAAMEPPASQPAMREALGTLESEDRISAPIGIETDRVEPEGVSEPKSSESGRLIPSDAAASRAMAEKHVESANTATEEASEGSAKGATQGEAPVIETGFERPESGNQSVVTGQQGGVEDLFSNWVDAPSSTAWMPRNPRPGNAPATPPAPTKVASTEAHKAAPEAVTVPPKPTIPVKESQGNGTAPAQRTTPAHAQLPPASTVSPSLQATTFTVGNYGMWRVSAPTAVGRLAAGPSQNDKGAAAPVVERPAEKETRDREQRSLVAKGANSEASTSKPKQDKAVQPPGAAKTSANDVAAKQVPIETADGSGATEMPKFSPASAAVKDGVQKSRPDVRTVKTGISQSAASALKTVSKAVMPAKGAAPKVQPKTSIGRTEAHGKPGTGPLSLGTRIRRWLNPVAQATGDRRRAHRRYVPGMVAHYYTGGSPKPHEVADISMTGFYLLTEDRWMPETMIQMTLQKPCAKGERKQSIVVLSKIVRRGSDGVAARFVMPEDLNPQSHDIQPSQATDRFSLARFL